MYTFRSCVHIVLVYCVHMKTKQLKVRCTQIQMDKIKELAKAGKSTVSSYVLERIIPKSFLQVNIPVMEEAPIIPEEGAPSGRRCMQQGCQETDTYHKYIDGCRAWFCAHHYTR